MHGIYKINPCYNYNLISKKLQQYVMLNDARSRNSHTTLTSDAILCVIDWLSFTVTPFYRLMQTSVWLMLACSLFSTKQCRFRGTIVPLSCTTQCGPILNDSGVLFAQQNSCAIVFLVFHSICLWFVPISSILIKLLQTEGQLSIP